MRVGNTPSTYENPLSNFDGGSDSRIISIATAGMNVGKVDPTLKIKEI
jgi:hypothetical protein